MTNHRIVIGLLLVLALAALTTLPAHAIPNPPSLDVSCNAAVASSPVNCSLTPTKSPEVIVIGAYGGALPCTFTVTDTQGNSYVVRVSPFQTGASTVAGELWAPTTKTIADTITLTGTGAGCATVGLDAFTVSGITNPIIGSPWDPSGPTTATTLGTSISINQPVTNGNDFVFGIGAVNGFPGSAGSCCTTITCSLNGQCTLESEYVTSPAITAAIQTGYLVSMSSGGGIAFIADALTAYQPASSCGIICYPTPSPSGCVDPLGLGCSLGFANTYILAGILGLSAIGLSSRRKH